MSKKLINECFEMIRFNNKYNVFDLRDHAAARIFAELDGGGIELSDKVLEALSEAFEVGYTVGQGTAYTGLFEMEGE